MKLALVVKEDLGTGVHLLNTGENSTGSVKIARERFTYKALNGLVISFNVTSVGNVKSYEMDVFEDLPYYMNDSLALEYVKEHGNTPYANIQDEDKKYEKLFNVETIYMQREIVGHVNDFKLAEEKLAVLKVSGAYKEIDFPEELKNQLDNAYMNHEEVQKINMGYNINLNCFLTKEVLQLWTSQAVIETKNILFANAVEEKETLISESPGVRTLNLKLVIKRG